MCLKNLRTQYLPQIPDDGYKYQDDGYKYHTIKVTIQYLCREKFRKGHNLTLWAHKKRRRRDVEK